MLSASAPSSILNLPVTGRPAWWPDKPSVMYPSFLHVALLEIPSCGSHRDKSNSIGPRKNWKRGNN